MLTPVPSNADKERKSYFSSNTDKLLLKKMHGVEDSLGKEIEEFVPNVNLGTRDIAYELLGIDPRVRNQNITYKETLQPHNNSLKKLVSAGKVDHRTIFYKIKNNKRLTPEELARQVRVNKITMKPNESTAKVALTQIEEFCPLESPINLQLTEDKIAQWRKNFKVYFSQDLTNAQKENIISSKLSEDEGIQCEGHKMTFMVESQFYLDSKDQVLPEPLPIKILGFCYPDLKLTKTSKFWQPNPSGYRPDFKTIKEELKEVFRINLLAVIAEAQKVGNPLPFFINITEALLKNFKSHNNANMIKKLIAESINDLKKEYSSLIKANISEFIVLGSPQFWGRKSVEEFKKDADYHTETHIVNADMLDIVQKLYNDRRITCPVPMTGDQSNPVGYKYLEVNFLQTDSNVLLARRTGGLHCAIFEGGVIKQITNAKGQTKDHLRSIDSDPVFKTFSKVQFNSCEVESQKFFYAKDQLNDAEISLDGIGFTIEHKLRDNFSPHCFKVNKISPHQDSSSIDVAPIFSTAVKNAVKGLEFLNEFENPDKSEDSIRDGKILFHIMAFANEMHGVGNKIEDLKKYFNRIYDEIFTDKNKSQKQTRIDKIAESAKTFSYKFQQEMKEKHGFLTGRYDAKNPEVGARLHRMASKENIMQFFANTKFAEKVRGLELEFTLAKEQLTNLDSPTPHHSPSPSTSPSTSRRNSEVLPAGQLPPASLLSEKLGARWYSVFGARAVGGLLRRLRSWGGADIGRKDRSQEPTTLVNYSCK